MSEENDFWFHAYNRELAKVKDLEEQLFQKQRQWSERDAEDEVTERLIRELCEEILGRRMQGTRKKSGWRNMTLKALVKEAKKALSEYTLENGQVLMKVLHISEGRRLQIESLENQIAIMKMSSENINLSFEEIQKAADKEKRMEETLKKIDYPVRKAADEGSVHITLEDEDVFDDFEKDMVKASLQITEKARVTPKSIPKTESRKRTEEIKKFRRAETTALYVDDLSKYTQELREVDWEVLDVIGSEGVSVLTEIIQALMKRNVEYKESALRNCIKKLYNMHLLSKETAATPVKGTITLYRLDEKGIIIYREHFKKDPVKSEMEKVVTEHDSYAHGYGILEIAEMLKEKPYIKTVKYMNRDRPILLGGGSSVIPDIICVEKNDRKSYFEYEIGNHNQTNFSAKCSKLCKLDRYLNFIVPNDNAVKKIREQVEKWMETKGHAIDGYTIRITTARAVKDNDIRKNAGWKVVYHPENGKEAEINV